MPKTVQLVTTKPNENIAEYAILEDEVVIRHGEQVTMPYDDLTAEQKAIVDNARTLLQTLAEADAQAKNLL